jgi:hypothetical protein
MSNDEDNEEASEILSSQESATLTSKALAEEDGELTTKKPAEERGLHFFLWRNRLSVECYEINTNEVNVLFCCR